MWGYVTGVKNMPTDKKLDNYDVLLETWKVNNSKIITWINNSVTPSIGLQFAKYETSKLVWDHLAKLYTQSNFAKQYQLETDIRALQQNDTTIQDFYSSMLALWGQLALTEPASLSRFDPYIKRREAQRLVWFLMACVHDFEGLQKGHWRSECPFKPKQPHHLNNGVAAPSLDSSTIEQFQKYLSF
ncbi:hypothetical protein Tco_1153827 [Tanacetum coccineum]